MAKKRSPSQRRPASATRRKTATTRSRRRATSSKRQPTAPRERPIQLKPLVALVGTTLDRLKRIQQTPATKRTIERLEMCSAELASICDDPTDPLGCGATMEFPPDPPVA